MKQKIAHFRQISLLVARSVDSNTINQTELDIMEFLQITRSVIGERLKAGIYTERQKDKRRKYTGLYQSIKLQVIDTIRDSFKQNNKSASGFVLQKYNTLVLDALFDALIAVGPERAFKLTCHLLSAARRDMLTLPEYQEFDTKVALTILQRKSKERANKQRKPLTKKQRLAAIARAVERINDLEEPT